MNASFRNLVFLTVLLAPVQNSNGQSPGFQEPHSYMGGGIGLFTYHGPVDLLMPGTGSNFTNEIEPAASLWGSFPILENWMSFRFMLVVANFNTSDGSSQVADGSNEFLTKRLLLFEPEIVVSLPSLGYGRVTPYVFGGFGGTLADFHGDDRNVVDFPGSGIPGPERSVFHIPFGFGIDVPVSDKYSLYGEASWRMDFNYVLENEPNYDSHSTSLIMAGLRVCLDCEKPVPPDPQPPLQLEPKPPKTPFEPPPSSPRLCSELADLDEIFFTEGSADLTDKAIAHLEENVEALAELQNSGCCVKITAHAGGEEVEAKLLAGKRALAVRHFYVINGIPESKISHQGKPVTEKCTVKGDRTQESCMIRNKAVTEPCDCIKTEDQ